MTPLELARRLEGLEEIPGPTDHPAVQWGHMLSGLGPDQPDETAWCSSFMNLLCYLTGYERTGQANARSWLGVGVPQELEAAQPGDVAVLWRVSPDSWQGHVGLIVNVTDEEIDLLGGNQCNAVSVQPFPRNRLLKVRRLRRVEELA